MKAPKKPNRDAINHVSDALAAHVERDDGLREHIRAEQDEKARTLLESGLMGYESRQRRIRLPAGDGYRAELVRASVGETEEVRTEHLRDLRRADEAAFPELQLWKRTSPAKIAAHQPLLADLADKEKQPSHLTKEHVVNLYSAIAFANSRGAIFNFHLSIRWDLLGVAGHEEAAELLQEKFLRYLNQWYSDRMKALGRRTGESGTQELCWVYVHECPPPKYQFHTHCLVSIPMGLKPAFQSWVCERIKAIWTGRGMENEPPKNAVEVVYRHTDQIVRQWKWFQYICKGIDPTVTIKMGRPEYKNAPPKLLSLLDVSYISPGPIRCRRRMGMSQNLSPQERKRAGFRSEMELKRFDHRTLFTSRVFDEWRAAQARERMSPPDMSEVFKALLSK